MAVRSKLLPTTSPSTSVPSGPSASLRPVMSRPACVLSSKLLPEMPGRMSVPPSLTTRAAPKVPLPERSLFWNESTLRVPPSAISSSPPPELPVRLRFWTVVVSVEPVPAWIERPAPRLSAKLLPCTRVAPIESTPVNPKSPVNMPPVSARSVRPLPWLPPNEFSSSGCSVLITPELLATSTRPSPPLPTVAPTSGTPSTMPAPKLLLKIWSKLTTPSSAVTTSPLPPLEPKMLLSNAEVSSSPSSKTIEPPLVAVKTPPSSSPPTPIAMFFSKLKTRMSESSAVSTKPGSTTAEEAMTPPPTMLHTSESSVTAPSSEFTVMPNSVPEPTMPAVPIVLSRMPTSMPAAAARMVSSGESPALRNVPAPVAVTTMPEPTSSVPLPLTSSARSSVPLPLRSSPESSTPLLLASSDGSSIPFMLASSPAMSTSEFSAMSRSSWPEECVRRMPSIAPKPGPAWSRPLPSKVLPVMTPRPAPEWSSTIACWKLVKTLSKIEKPPVWAAPTMPLAVPPASICRPATVWPEPISVITSWSGVSKLVSSGRVELPASKSPRSVRPSVAVRKLPRPASPTIDWQSSSVTEVARSWPAIRATSEMVPSGLTTCSIWVMSLGRTTIVSNIDRVASSRAM